MFDLCGHNCTRVGGGPSAPRHRHVAPYHGRRDGSASPPSYGSISAGYAYIWRSRMTMLGLAALVFAPRCARISLSDWRLPGPRRRSSTAVSTRPTKHLAVGRRRGSWGASWSLGVRGPSQALVVLLIGHLVLTRTDFGVDHRIFRRDRVVHMSPPLPLRRHALSPSYQAARTRCRIRPGTLCETTVMAPARFRVEGATARRFATPVASQATAEQVETMGADRQRPVQAPHTVPPSL